MHSDIDFAGYKSWLMVALCCILSTIISSCSKQSDGSHASNMAQVSLLHTLPASLQESSGLCFTDGRLWSFGDSGNPPCLFSIDTVTGDILQTVTVQNFANTDWEDITSDDEYIYIGDIGNNNGNRTDLRILRVRKKDMATTATDITVRADVIYFSYADQTDFAPNKHSNFNCEALLALQDNLYLFSKDESDFRTRCYKLSKTPGTYEISPISSFDCRGEITSAAYNPLTNELALGGYQSQKLHPFIWFFTYFTNDDFFEGERKLVSLSNDGKAWQTEGLDYISAKHLFLSCESTSDVPASLFSIIVK